MYQDQSLQQILCMPMRFPESYASFQTIKHLLSGKGRLRGYNVLCRIHSLENLKQKWDRFNTHSLSALHRLTYIPPRNLLSRVQNLHTTMLSVNWEDHLTAVQNLAFFEGENTSLQHEAYLLLVHKTLPTLHHQLRELDMMITCFKQCAFVHDYLLELLQCVDHADAHSLTEKDFQVLFSNIQHIQEILDVLLQKYPFLSPKIEECVGSPLRLLRQRIRFDVHKQS